MRRGIRDKAQTCSTMGHSINKCFKVSIAHCIKRYLFIPNKAHSLTSSTTNPLKNDKWISPFTIFFFFNSFFIFSSNFSFHQICTRCFKKRMPYPVAWRSNYIHITFIKKINKLHTYYNHLKLIRTLLNSSFRL